MTDVDGTDKTVAGIRAQLAEQASRLEQRCDELQAQLHQCESDRACVSAALRELDGTGGARRSPTARRPPTFDTDEVVGLIQAMLQPNATMELAELRGKLETEARTAGRSCVGLRVRFKKALRDGRFVVADRGEQKVVRLRAAGDGPAA